jgi:glycosyltransferase involved in cell wall biosynthesis
VRENRGKTGKDGFLVIGNTGNLQTRKGMETLGRYWQENQLETVGGKLLLGGFQSNGFFTPGQFGSSVEFLGTLPNDTLDSILARVKAVICYQENGAGALTRICEMLMAGVPVLANSYAARSYYNMKGVVEFRELNELKEALKQVDKLEGEIPVPATPDISLVSLKIQKILK